MEEKRFVRDLVEGEKVSAAFYVSFKRPIQTYAKGFWFELRVGDRTGELPAKYWGGRNEEAVQMIFDSIRDGDIVLVSGTVQKYRDRLEISANPEEKQGVKKLKPGEYDLSHFVAVTDKNIPEMYCRLLEWVGSIQDPYLSKLLCNLFQDDGFAQRFQKCPAAIKHHGNVVGGLLEHTLATLDICHSMQSIYSELDRDLMVAGALLHDIGKVEEYEVSTRISASDPGRLMGHIFLGAEMVRKQIASIEGFPDTLAWKLTHTILSSHGAMEYGSPVVPMFPEALAISLADEAEARMDKMLRLMRTTRTEDDWTYCEDVGSVYLK
ncbi:MAG: Dihydroneopterin 2',3'-cyclic phosphate phosphodiesterase [Methanomassiliicoccales archaeon PtaU1.Bin124]|nr:MAG: Dihydroneopterin 2',3'-cyclic phosphate phosphodiesterase [Methanomassiliicoccales archaeon PtaU1.Bin124]